MNGYFVADAGEDIQRFAGFRSGVAHAVGGQEREVAGSGEIKERLVVGFFGAVEMALEFDIDVFCAVDVRDARVGARGEADQAWGEFGKFFGSCGAFAFLCAHFHSGDQTAEILVAGAAFG